MPHRLIRSLTLPIYLPCHRARQKLWSRKVKLQSTPRVLEEPRDEDENHRRPEPVVRPRGLADDVPGNCCLDEQVQQVPCPQLVVLHGEGRHGLLPT